MLSWQLASVALVAVEGTAGLWLSVKTDAPPGATIACVSGAVFALVAAARSLPRVARPALPALAAALALGALARRLRAGRGRLRRAARGGGDDHRGRRLGARGRRRRGRGRAGPGAEHRPARVRAAAQRRRRRGGRRAGLRQRRRPRRLDRRGRLRQRQRRRGRRPRRRRARPAAGRGGGGRGRRVRPALVARPAQRRGRGRRDRTPPGRRRPGPPAPLRGNAERYLGAPAAARPRHRPLHRRGPAGAAQAGHRPRRLRLLRPPLRDRGRRRGDPLADDPGAALGQGPRRAGADDRGGAGQRDLPGELAEPEAGRGDRRPDRRLGRAHPLRRLARPGGLARRHLPRDGGGERRRDGRRLQRRERAMPPQP